MVPELNVRFRSEYCMSVQSHLSYCMALSSDSNLHRNSWIDELDGQSRWQKRGWVYQEITLSPRPVIFTRHGIVLICGEKYVCEDGSQGWWPGPRLGGLRDARLNASPFRKFGNDTSHIAEREFTHYTDRLPAIAGLAKRVADLTGSEYFAGLFKDDLIRGLLFYKLEPWIRQSFHERLHHLSEPGSAFRPSWSWAGLSGLISYPGELSRHATAEFELIEASTVSKDGTPFGRVQEGYLKIRVGIISLRNWVHENEDVAKQVVNGGHLGVYSAGLNEVLWDTHNSDAEDVLINNISLIPIMEQQGCTIHGLFVFPAGNEGYFYRFGRWKGFHWGKNRNIEAKTISLI